MTDIIIGARKPRPRRTRRLLVFGIACVIVYVAARWAIGFLTAYPNPDVELPRGLIELSTTTSAEAAGAASAPLPTALRFADATLSGHGPVVLRAEGQPAELGTAAGRLLGSALDEQTTLYESRARSAHAGSDFFARIFGRRRGDWRLRHIDDGIPGHQLVEIAGLALGARASGARAGYDGLVRAQAVFDLAPPDPSSEGSDLRAVSIALTVVNPLRGASGDRLLMGRSFSTPGVAPSSPARPVIVRFFRPRGVIPFAAIGDPATVGTLTGLNGEGLAIAAHPIETVDRASSDSAQPTPLLVRDILENARSAEQAVAILEAANPLGSAIYVIVDAASRSAVVIERTPARFGVLPEAQTRVVVDLLGSDELADEPESERNRRLRRDADRAARVTALLRESPPRSPQDLAGILRDRADAEGRPLPLGDRAQVADPTADHVVILDAAALVIWVNEGPGPFGRFVAFDLRHELRGEGKRPAPPPDIPADAIAVDARNVAAARVLLYQAREQRKAGKPGAAREALARALILAPRLPPAIRLADEIGLVIPGSAASKPTKPDRDREGL